MKQSDLRLGSTGHSRQQTGPTTSLSLFTWEDKNFPVWVLLFQHLVGAKVDFSKARLTEMTVHPIPTLVFTEELLSPQVQGPGVFSGPFQCMLQCVLQAFTL